MSPARTPVKEASPRDALAALVNDPTAVLVDVRTRPEWMYVGLPTLPGGKDPLLLEWQLFPSMAVNSEFGQELSALVGEPSTPIYFLCRSGVRSVAAAQRMIELGYENCFNVTDGFEGPPDGDGHRGTVAGWKANDCPWRQS